jgi:aminoglycoside phosphotransferase family enzyme
MGIGKGRIVEYAVKMKRLSDEMLMKSVFLKGELKTGHLRKIARVLARFHLSARNSVDIDKFGEPGMFRVNTDENFAQTEKYIGRTIQRKAFDALKKWTTDFYNSYGELFWRRIKAKKIRDCHGDLHMEHICLTEDLPIFDCIEFNKKFRYTDTVCDIAFLVMDFEYHGGNAYSKILWDLYKEMAEQVYLNNKKRFQTVDLEDLKALYPSLDIIHLLVDTTSDLVDEWYVIGKMTR